MRRTLILRGALAGLAGLAMALACVLEARAAGDGSYTYTDDQGGVHLTNVPDDGHYTVLIPSAQATAAATASAPASAASSSRPGDTRLFKKEVEQASAHAGVDGALLHAVIMVESGYNPRAVSKRGAAGLMQLMPETARRYKVSNVFDPAQNIRAGAQYLADLLKLFGNNLHLALAAYNAGEGAVLKYGRSVPPFPETTAYVPKVIDYYSRMRLAASSAAPDALLSMLDHEPPTLEKAP